MLSETEYVEQIKSKRNTEYLAMIDKSMAEMEAGEFIVKTIDELEAFGTTADSFYSAKNIAELERRIKSINSKDSILKEHELINIDN